MKINIKLLFLLLLVKKINNRKKKNKYKIIIFIITAEGDLTATLLLIRIFIINANDNDGLFVVTNWIKKQLKIHGTLNSPPFFPPTFKLSTIHPHPAVEVEEVEAIVVATLVLVVGVYVASGNHHVVPHYGCPVVSPRLGNDVRR